MVTILIDVNGEQLSFPKGSTGLQIARRIGLLPDMLGLTVNDVVYDITRSIEEDATIRFLTWEDALGKQLFWHSAAHLLAAALESLYPTVQLGMGPPIEQGFYYDVDLGNDTATTLDTTLIEEKMLALAQRGDAFIRRAVSKQEAIAFFKEKGNGYKLELIEGLEEGRITFYQLGDFIDLCKGPHLPHSGWIKAVKILTIAGAYWRGNIHNKQLTRIYGIAFPEQKALAAFLALRAEAARRSHQKIGKELKLFTFSEKVGLGLPLWLPKGALLYDILVQFLKKEQIKRGYQPVCTPHIGHKALYLTSGHYEKYQEDCFQPIHTAEVEETYLLKPMNCPHHCEIYSSAARSYKELPLRLAEFGTVYRYERHGALHGLTRTRCFTQDDAHIFCRLDQVKDEFSAVIDLVLHVFNILHFTDYKAQLSFRDPKQDKYIGSLADWSLAEQAIQEVVTAKGLQATTVLGEAAFYGPKVDFMVKDALGRNWQLGTVQLDYQLPIRFDLTYIGTDGQKYRPVMIHRAPFGSLERLIAILIEHTAGNFPFWLAPEQVALLPLSDTYATYATTLYRLLLEREIRSVLDLRNETIGKKIREAALQKIPYILVVGEKEVETGYVSVRKQNKQISMLWDDFITQVCSEANLPS
ncbi:threonine--tRNA ligase [Candidatus Cardinium hertigii]|uniref:Threonine--tRNA ligase n=1 Tax=Candidatus Cardinium hertigii TaxID=247481 RepID=A0A2Z3LID1_9BACT|nr:threonine--tRNA ligase [Candidatus Cardinium hertigii]AWN82285.1 Threonine--tRNA ligase [Candidatus Cardinium hertigii]